MPTYEYACLSCGTHVEVYQRFSEDPLTVCGVCGGQLRKVFHPAGILFKGSGFYATDSRAKSRGTSGDGEKGDSAASEKAGSTAGSAGSAGSSTGEGGSSKGGGGSAEGESAGKRGSTSGVRGSKEKSA